MKKVLLIDDDDKLANAAKNYLNKKGFIVTASQSCDDALTAFRDFQPDVVVLGVHAEEDPNIDLCETIKKQSESRRIPVILTSADQKVIEFYPYCNADAAIPKPFTMNLLAEVIRLQL